MEYAMLLEAYLDAFASCGSLDLLSPLLPTFRAGKKHRYFQMICDTLKHFVAALVPQAGLTIELGRNEAVISVCNLCFDMLISEEKQEVKQLYIEHICLPLLNELPESLLVQLMTTSDLSLGNSGSMHSSSTISKLIKIIKTSTPSVEILRHDQEVDSFFTVLEYSYQILEIIYNRYFCTVFSRHHFITPFLFDRCALVHLKSEINTAYTAVTTNTGTELYKEIIKTTHKLIRESEFPLNLSPLVKLNVCSCAYSCLMVVVSKTQQDEKVFEMFLFKEKPGEVMWANVIDLYASYRLHPDSPIFKSIVLGPGRNDDNPLRCKKTKKAISKFGMLSLPSDYAIGSLQELSCISVSATGNSMLHEFENDSFLKENRPSTQMMSVLTLGDTSIERNCGIGVTTVPFDAQGFDEIEDASVPGFDDYPIKFELNDINEQKCMPMLVRVIMVYIFNIFIFIYG